MPKTLKTENPNFGQVLSSTKMLKLLSSTIRNSNFVKIPTCHFYSIIPPSNPAIQFILEEAQEPIQRPSSGNGEISRPKEEFDSHPWPEWVDLMEKLLKNGYFSGDGNQINELGIKDSNQIRTACLNFARDQFDLVRYLSQKDIEVIAHAGCPSIDRKVVNSGKRLRAHLGIDEGNVCSSCILRGNCERAYVKGREGEGGRTVDVMRFLLTYGLDPISGTVENKPCLNKRLKESVRKLLKEIVEFSREEEDGYETNKALNTGTGRSFTQQIVENCRDGQMKVPMKQGDWLCTKCNFLNFARNIKCLRCNDLSQEKLHNLRGEQDNLPLKKGDWICDKCNFLNFAKNTRCLQCKENPPERLLHPGEWECESCNYINFKRNMVCLKCDHRRPRVSNCAASPNTNNHLSRPYFGMEQQLRDEPKFVKGDPDETGGYVDFPILGGKSDLSRNEQMRERWKREMGKKSTKAAKAKQKAHQFKSCFVQDSNNHFQLTDDEQMDDWFQRQ